MKVLMILFFFALSHSLFASEAIGFYSDGQLLRAKSVFEYGTPIQKLFIARNRLYTTDEMHKVLTMTSEFLQKEFPHAEVLQVGDLSHKEGGLANGHASHQNGLDADIVYLRNNGYVQSSDSTDWDEDFIEANKPSKNFNLLRNYALFKFIVNKAPVGRIFVDPSIKRALCEYAQKRGEMKSVLVLQTLRRLRPADLHRTHFHLRLECGVHDHECIKQTAPVEGAGCDELSLMLEAAMGDNAC